MHPSFGLRRLIAALVVLFVAREGVVLGRREGLLPLTHEAPHEQAVVQAERAQDTVRLDEAAARLIGIQTAVMPPSTYQSELPMYGLAVSLGANGPVGSQSSGPTEIRLVIPAATTLDPIPSIASVEDATGQRVPARMIIKEDSSWSIGRARTAWYRVEQSGIRWPSDLRVRVRLPIGLPRQGVIVPDSAVVWLDGKAWVYVTRAVAPDASDASKPAEEFGRREIPVDAQTTGGWFVPDGFGDNRVVVEGAQLLLSTEYQSDVPHE